MGQNPTANQVSVEDPDVKHAITLQQAIIDQNGNQTTLHDKFEFILLNVKIAKSDMQENLVKN